MLPLVGRKAFGPFEICLETGQLWRGGTLIRIAPQPCRVLAQLVAGEGHLVTREELRAALWADGTTVEFDQGLNFCVRQVRVVLADDGRRPTFIETIPKKGYRLLVAVRDVSIEAPPLPPPVAKQTSRWRLALVPAAAGLLALAAWAWARESRPSTEPVEVHRLRQEAEQLASTWEVLKVREAARLYQEAATLAPSDARAWAGLANADVVLAQLLGSTDLLSESERTARRAYDLDQSLADASAALAHNYWQQWRWRDAGELFARSVVTNPDEPGAQQLYGLYLASIGRGADAIARARRAVDLAPTAGLINFSLAQVYLHAGDPEAALTQARRTLDMDRHFPLAYRVILRASLQLGRDNEALQALADERRFVPDKPNEAWEPYLLARLGRTAEARHLLAQGPRGAVLPLGHIAALAVLGDTDAAFAALDLAIAQHSSGVLWLKVTPELEAMRQDPRFSGMLSRMSLQ